MAAKKLTVVPFGDVEAFNDEYAANSKRTIGELLRLKPALVMNEVLDEATLKLTLDRCMIVARGLEEAPPDRFAEMGRINPAARPIPVGGVALRLVEVGHDFIPVGMPGWNPALDPKSLLLHQVRFEIAGAESGPGSNPEIGKELVGIKTGLQILPGLLEGSASFIRQRPDPEFLRYPRREITPSG